MSGYKVLSFHAAIVDVPEEECEDPGSGDQTVAVFLGEHEVARVPVTEAIWYDGQIRLEETVADWLRGKLR